MKTIFDDATRDELFQRLDVLTPAAERQWGKMTPSQAMEHTARALEMAAGIKPMRQHWMGKLFAWVFMKNFVGEKPFMKNAPTGPDFIIGDEPDFETTRERLKEMINTMHDLGEDGSNGNVHGFFGPLTGQQWGLTQYKHVDHHLRQFGV